MQRLQVSINLEHLHHGKPRDAEHCALAEALQEQHDPHATVSTDHALIHCRAGHFPSDPHRRGLRPFARSDDMRPLPSVTLMSKAAYAELSKFCGRTYSSGGPTKKQRPKAKAKAPKLVQFTIRKALRERSQKSKRKGKGSKVLATTTTASRPPKRRGKAPTRAQLEANRRGFRMPDRDLQDRLRSKDTPTLLAMLKDSSLSRYMKGEVKSELSRRIREANPRTLPTTRLHNPALAQGITAWIERRNVAHVEAIEVMEVKSKEEVEAIFNSVYAMSVLTPAMLEAAEARLVRLEHQEALNQVDADIRNNTVNIQEMFAV